MVSWKILCHTHARNCQTTSESSDAMNSSLWSVTSSVSTMKMSHQWIFNGMDFDSFYIFVCVWLCEKKQPMKIYILYRSHVLFRSHNVWKIVRTQSESSVCVYRYFMMKMTPANTHFMVKLLRSTNVLPTKSEMIRFSCLRTCNKNINITEWR